MEADHSSPIAIPAKAGIHQHAVKHKCLRLMLMDPGSRPGKRTLQIAIQSKWDTF